VLSRMHGDYSDTGRTQARTVAGFVRTRWKNCAHAVCRPAWRTG